jgi:hypothetical protein
VWLAPATAFAGALVGAVIAPWVNHLLHSRRERESRLFEPRLQAHTSFSKEIRRLTDYLDEYAMQVSNLPPPDFDFAFSAYPHMVEIQALGSGEVGTAAEGLYQALLKLSEAVETKDEGETRAELENASRTYNAAVRRQLKVK